jgi:hypothetical protein
MKSKGLVRAGTALIIISLVYATFGLAQPQSASIKAPGGFEITGIEASQAIPLFIFVVLFFTGVGLLVKGFI